MHRKQVARRSSSVYALVVVFDPIGESRTVHATLNRGADRLWSITEAVRADHPLEPAMIGIWRVLGEAIRRDCRRLDLYVSDPGVIDLLERRVPVPNELGKLFLTIRARFNQIGKVRLVAMGEEPLPQHRAARAGAREEERSLFDPAVA